MLSRRAVWRRLKNRLPVQPVTGGVVRRACVVAGLLLLGACTTEPLLDSVIPAELADAMDASGSELPEAKAVPLPLVVALEGAPDDGAITLRWATTAGVPVAGFRLVASPAVPGPPWPIDRFLVGETSASISGLVNGVAVHAAVSAIDARGVEGPLSHVVEVTPTFQPGSQVLVPAGPALLGERQPEDPDAPLVSAHVAAFRIDRYPVTNAQYAVCMGEGACPEPVARWGWVAGRGLVDDVLADKDTTAHPVASLSWEAARAVCESRGMRLPTAAEWQKAARGPAPSRHAWPWGDDAPRCALASFAGDDGFCTTGTEPIGSHREGRSPTGAQDMAGGVWEWVEDAPEDDPSLRLLFGGAWYVDARASLVGHATRAAPALEPPRDPVRDYRGYGVRCAADATSSPRPLR